MFTDTLLYDCTLRALYHHAIREGALARMVGVMSAEIGASGRFYNAVRGL